MLDHCDRSLPSNRTVASEGALPACSGVLGVAGATTGGCGRLRSWSSQFGSGCAKHAQGRAPRAARFRTVEVRRDFLEFIARDYSQSRCIWASILTDCRGRGKDRVFLRAVREDAPFHFGNRQASGNLEKMSACKRAGPPWRWRKRFWNLRVVARLRGLSLRHSSSQTCAKLTTTRRNRLSAKAALELWTRLRSSPSVTSRA